MQRVDIIFFLVISKQHSVRTSGSVFNIVLDIISTLDSRTGGLKRLTIHGASKDRPLYI